MLKKKKKKKNTYPTHGSKHLYTRKLRYKRNTNGVIRQFWFGHFGEPSHVCVTYCKGNAIELMAAVLSIRYLQRGNHSS